jgi:hypothetical protein
VDLWHGHRDLPRFDQRQAANPKGRNTVNNFNTEDLGTLGDWIVLYIAAALVTIIEFFKGKKKEQP